MARAGRTSKEAALIAFLGSFAKGAMEGKKRRLEEELGQEELKIKKRQVAAEEAKIEAYAKQKERETEAEKKQTFKKESQELFENILKLQALSKEQPILSPTGAVVGKIPGMKPSQIKQFLPLIPGFEERQSALPELPFLEFMPTPTTPIKLTEPRVDKPVLSPAQQAALTAIKEAQKQQLKGPLPLEAAHALAPLAPMVGMEATITPKKRKALGFIPLPTKEATVEFKEIAKMAVEQQKELIQKKKLSRAKAIEFLERAGGDAIKALELLSQEGYEDVITE